MEMQQFLSAMESYQSLYGDYPAGKPSGILTALRGSNPQKIIFLNVDTRTNSSGELVDPWETPYQVVFDSTNHFTIQSAGKNKRFGDEDDFKLSSSEQR